MSEYEDVVKDYNRAQNFPFLIGKVGDWRIWGGPYTITQLVSLGVVFFVGKESMPIWGAALPPFAAWGSLLIFSFVSAYFIGRFSFGGRNPLLVALGVFTYFTASKYGLRGNKEVRIPRIKKYRHLVSFNSHESEVSGESVLVRESNQIAPELLMVKPSIHKLNEVQRLLAASAQRR